MTLPQAFITDTAALFGSPRWQRFLGSFEQAAPVSIRLNPWKTPDGVVFDAAVPVPWCRGGYWLPARPDFTLDPLSHAGVYYVQEAGSLFLDTVLRQYVHAPVLALDLCAAPGGKATLMRAALPPGSMLVANEPDRRRANILLENMLKQGHPDVLVTHNYAGDFSKTNWTFDVILTDVPCSGEGLFRRDAAAMTEWSPDTVRFCQKRQRRILQEIWPCLRPGGLLIYSTCTFNTHENEENVRFVCDELGARVLPVPTAPEWDITGSLLAGWEQPVYRFIPGITKSEGLFMAVLQKNGMCDSVVPRSEAVRRYAHGHKLIHVLSDGVADYEQKGKEKIPSAAQALSIATGREQFARVELSLEQARRYLHRESFALPPGTPRGFVVVSYRGQALGFMKNLGERANNLYPKNWAVRK